VNKSPRCAVMVESIVSGFKITPEVEDLFSAQWNYNLGFHGYYGARRTAGGESITTRR